MFISTKGRYALRVMIDLLENGADGYVPLKEISARQGISQKYLESIMSLLSKGHLVDGASGKGGGYRLCRTPEDYRIGEILRLTEGSLAPVTCLEDNRSHCTNSSLCYMMPVWEGLSEVIDQYLDGITLADVVRHGKEQAF